MPVTVRVRNVQSIEDVTIVIDGFTVISGPNNSGKTAIMRAIKGVFTNAPAGPLVRHGAAHIIVDIDFGDGNTVTWKKGWKKPGQMGGTVNEYTVNGKKLGDKVGRGCPDEVAALGVRFIDAGTERLWPQVADQFKGVLFLVDAPGSVVAEAVADVDRVGKLSKALKLSEKDRRSIVSTLNIRRKDILTVEEEIKAFAGFDDVVTSVKDLEETAHRVDTQAELFQFFYGLYERYEAAREKTEALDGVEDIPLPDSTTGTEGRKLASRLMDLTGLETRYGYISEKVKRLDGVDDLGVPQTHLAQEERNELLTILALHGNHRVAAEAVKRLEGVADVALPSKKSIAGATKVQSALSFLVNIKSRGSALEGEIARLEKAIAEADVELTDAQTEVGVIIGKLGICPTSRRPVEEPHNHTDGPL